MVKILLVLGAVILMAPSAIIAILQHFFLAWPIPLGGEKSERIEAIACICAIIGLLILGGMAIWMIVSIKTS